MFLKIIKAAWKVIETATIVIPVALGIRDIWKKK
jgi:hypothetical protein